MLEKTKAGLAILISSLILGLLGNLLLRATPWGINLLISISALLITIELLTRRQLVSVAADRRWLAIPTLGAALAFCWRDSLTLNTLSIMAIFIALSLAAFRARDGWLRVAGLCEYLFGAAISSCSSMFGGLFLLGNDIKWQMIPRGRWSTQAIAVARGLIIAVPMLFIFGLLFMSADAIFANYVNRIFNFNIETFFSHIALTIFFSCMMAGFLRTLLLSESMDLRSGRPSFLSLGIIEIGLIMTLLDLLFLSFVLIQLRYLFGGAELIRETIGLNYAEYARRGFFELVTVATLVLPILLSTHWLLRKEESKHVKIYNVLAGGQIVLLFVIIASAIMRMRLYQSEYGMTELRFYTMAFMIWLAILFVWFAATVLRNQREYFAFGALLSGFVMIGVLHVINPDAVIARTNLARASEGKIFDVNYLTVLSADATPEIIEGLAALKNADQAIIAQQLLQRNQPDKNIINNQDLRSWNYARWSASRQIKNINSLLETKLVYLPKIVVPTVPVEVQPMTTAPVAPTVTTEPPNSRYADSTQPSPTLVTPQTTPVQPVGSAQPATQPTSQPTTKSTSAQPMTTQPTTRANKPQTNRTVTPERREE